MTPNLTRQKQLAVGLIVWAFASAAFASADPFLTLNSTVQTNGQLQFNLNGEDSVTYVIEGSSDLQNWTPVLTNSDQPATRTITVDGSQNFGFYRASRGPLPLFAGAITARSNLVLEGSGVYTDSYDSSKTNLFPGGLYNPSNRMDHGDVAVGTNFISIVNAEVMGKVWIDGGTIADVELGPISSVGDVPWIMGGGTGFESPAFFTNDFRFCLPDVEVPFTSGQAISPPTAGNTNTLSSGMYFYNGNFSIPSGADLQVGPNQSVILYVTGNFTMSISAKIDIQPGGTLLLYVAGATASFGQIDIQGTDLNLQYYGLPRNANITFGGNAAFLGTIYAPEATVTLDGLADLTGAIVANSVHLNADASVHYDEALARIGPQR